MAGLYEVTFRDGARISESPRFPIEVACLKVGTEVTVVEVKDDKARITKPVRGWCALAHIARKNTSTTAKAVPKIEVGDRCVLIDGRVGTVRYAGTTGFAKGNWFGVALDKPEGKHNGMVKGKRYFDCPAQHGVFVRMNKIAKVKSAKKSGGGASTAGQARTNVDTKTADKPGRARWYGCWFFEGEESYVDLTLDVGPKRLSGEAVDEDNDNLVINGTVKQDDQGHPKWTFKMTMKGEPTIINVGVLINGRIKGVWKVLDSWGKFEMCPAKNLEQGGASRNASLKNKKTAIV